jgi:electron transfer flavoprotein alpha subunit
VLLEDAELDAPVKLVTLAPGADRPAVETGAVPSVVLETFTPRLAGTSRHSSMVGHTARESGVSLATAPVVVSGGRGVGSADGFAPLEELAGLIGGAVGCSRVATNNGWRPHSDQVGLTGTKIAPALYIACGISGASQHWVGCMDAKRILAINTDPEAPMVTRAAYAVIGDVHEVLDAVIAEVRRRAQS